MSFTPEYEVKILDIDPKDVTRRILANGGNLVFSGLQNRHIFDIPNCTDNAWLRLRSSEKGTTLTVKKIGEDGTQELEVIVDDHDKMLAMLAIFGIQSRAQQQNHRTLYQLPRNIEVAIDTWPQLPSFMEIEGQNMNAVLATVVLLGFRVEQANQQTITQIYASNGIEGINNKDLVFSTQELDALTR